MTLIKSRLVFVSSDRGSIKTGDRHTGMRYTEEQTALFIQYVLSPRITVDMSFSEKSLKLSPGDILVVPNTIRNLLPTHIIQTYKGYCNECDEGFKALDDTCLFEILHRFCASNRKSL